MGQLRKRGSIWWIRYYRNGRRHEESSRSKKKGDAEALLKLREGAVARGEAITAKVGQVRFDEAAADVVNDYEINGKRTLYDVQKRIEKHLEPFFGGRRMASITTSDIRAYAKQRQAGGAANATINRELAIVKRAFRLAEQAGKILHRPHIPMLKERNVRQGFFERDEFEAVRAELPGTLRGLITFAYLTGWRTSEVLGLQWSTVDREEKLVRLEPGTTKNDEGRTFPYSGLPELADVVDGAWAEHQRLASEGKLCPWVFHRDGKRIKSFRNAWLAACERAGLPGKLVHDFRRTAVRNLVRAGVPDTVAMKLTGHKTRSVFDRYAVTSEADLRDAVRMLEASTVPATGTKEGQSARSGRVARFPESAASR